MIKFLKTIQLRCVSASFFLTSRIECIDLLCFRVRLQGSRTFNNSDLKLQHMNRKGTDIQDVGESTLVVGEQTVGETTGFHPSKGDNFALWNGHRRKS